MKQFLLLIVVFAGQVWADLTIEITQGIKDAVPIAVVPFGTSGLISPDTDIAEVISRDLELSGQFKPLSPDLMLSTPHLQEDVAFSDWRKAKVDYLLIGNLEAGSGDNYRIRYQLFDVYKQQSIGDGVFPVKKNQLRKGAHFISDDAYERITGVKGVFSTRIMYVTVNKDEAKPYQLQMADSDGFNAKTILRSKEPLLSPNWSPDGYKVAYVSFQSSRPAIYMQELNTGKQERLTNFKGLNGAPAWSPDGKQLAMVLSKDGNPEIYVMDMSSRALSRVTHHRGIDTEPAWSADGGMIYFTSNRGGSAQIYKIPVKGGRAERITFEGKYNAKPVISPDGRYLVMVHKSKDKRYHIGVKDLDKDVFAIVTDTRLDESPSIAPNGSMLIYASIDEQGEGILSAVSPDGRVKFRLPAKKGEVREPAWSPFY